VVPEEPEGDEVAGWRDEFLGDRGDAEEFEEVPEGDGFEGGSGGLSGTDRAGAGRVFFELGRWGFVLGFGVEGVEEVFEGGALRSGPGVGRACVGVRL
jgi:hypothetical protein